MSTKHRNLLSGTTKSFFIALILRKLLLGDLQKAEHSYFHAFPVSGTSFHVSVETRRDYPREDELQSTLEVAFGDNKWITRKAIDEWIRSAKLKIFLVRGI